MFKWETLVWLRSNGFCFSWFWPWWGVWNKYNRDKCYVLDGDPDEPALVGGDGRSNRDESEDLIVIREKMKVSLLHSHCFISNWIFCSLVKWWIYENWMLFFLSVSTFSLRWSIVHSFVLDWNLIRIKDKISYFGLLYRLEKEKMGIEKIG